MKACGRFVVRREYSEAEAKEGKTMMRKIGVGATVLCGLAVSAAAADSPNLEAVLPSGVDQVVHRAGEIEWGPCPPGPLAGDGCRMAVLEGNPKAEQLFTFRIRITEPFVLSPHTHPRNERVTVIEGALYVGFGDTIDKARSTRFEAGDYYINRAGAHHFVWSDEPTTVQLTGIGPWAIHPVAGKTPAAD